METYLQWASGDSLDAVSLQDIQNAIAAIKELDDEHGAFWVGMIEEEEIVLETHKDLTVIGIFPQSGGEEISRQLRNWSEVEHLYTLFLDCNFEVVKSILTKS